MVDANIGYDLFKNTSLSLNVDNVFNRASTVNVRTTVLPLRGRTARIAIEHKF